jgi:hypothetical protein
MMRNRILGLLAVAALTFAPVVARSSPAGATAPHVLGRGDHVIGLTPTATGQGYWLATTEGYVLAGFGDSVSYGSMAGTHLNAPVVGIAGAPDGNGYWLVGADGGVFAFGDSGFYGSMAGRHLNAPVVGMALTADGKGYWLVADDGGVFAFGDALFSGSLGGSPLSPPQHRVVGIGAFPDESHYWLITASGWLTVFGFSGGSWPTGWADISTTAPTAPFVAVANWGTRSDFTGVWMVGADGGVITLGGAGFHGSMGGTPLNAPVVGMAATADENGYWLVAADGGIFAFGDARFFGSAAG